MTSRRLHPAWIVLGAVTICLLASTGLRATFAVYIKPMEAEIGWSRGALSIAAAISLLLLGAIGPLRGPAGRSLGSAARHRGVDRPARHRRRSPWRSCTPCGSSTSPSASSWPLGAGGAALSTGSSVVARWFQTHRGTAIGFAAGGMSAGQLIVIPLASWIVLGQGWRVSALWLGAGAARAGAPAGRLAHPQHARGARPAAVRRHGAALTAAQVQAEQAGRPGHGRRGRADDALLAPDGDLLRVRLHQRRHDRHPLHSSRARAQLHRHAGLGRAGRDGRDEHRGDGRLGLALRSRRTPRAAGHLLLRPRPVADLPALRLERPIAALLGRPLRPELHLDGAADHDD